MYNVFHKNAAQLHIRLISVKSSAMNCKDLLVCMWGALNTRCNVWHKYGVLLSKSLTKES